MFLQLAGTDTRGRSYPLVESVRGVGREQGGLRDLHGIYIRHTR